MMKKHLVVAQLFSKQFHRDNCHHNNNTQGNWRFGHHIRPCAASSHQAKNISMSAWRKCFHVVAQHSLLHHDTKTKACYEELHQFMSQRINERNILFFQFFFTCNLTMPASNSLLSLWSGNAKTGFESFSLIYN